jgi:hypothetical protein
MIDVFVLFVGMYGGFVPIMELPDQKTCDQYAAHYSKAYTHVECKHLLRYDRHFRPKHYGK